MVGTVGTVPMYRTHRTHRTHYTYPVSDRSSNRFLFCLSKNVLIHFKDIKKSLARSVANWVRMVGTVGTVHGYGGTVDLCCTWVRWQSTWVRYNRYGARTQTFTQHPYPHPTTVHNTNSRNRTQQYPTPVPVPNTRTQHPYPTPVPVPNTRTEHPYPYPYL